MSLPIEPAVPADAPAIRALLTGSALPVEDLGSAPLRLWVARDGATVAGAIGLERYGTSALLRSLAVAPGHRRRGIGEALVGRLESDSRADGIRVLVLLTETAEAFFRRRGYAVVDRASVSEGVRASAEFRSLCPVSAVCLSKSLFP